MTDVDKMKYTFLGYSNIAKPPWNIIKRTIIQCLTAFEQNFDYKTNSIVCGKELYAIECTEESIREEVRKFYEENFTLHDVYLADDNFLKKINPKTDIIDGYTKLIEYCKKVSILDLPLDIDGKPCTMLGGDIKKLIVPIPDSMIPKSIGKQVSFLRISLRGEPNITMAVTYAHELMHALLESRPGYTSDLVYREVISVFIERVFAERLKQEESISLEKIRTTYEMSLLINNSSSKSKAKEDDVLHAIGSLMGIKLYEKYSNEKKEKKKKEYFEDIQNIIDGRMTVEKLLNKRGITVNGALDPLFVKKHL